MSNPSKTALVTGGSRGIGAAICQRLAADGYAVCVNYAGNVAAAEATVATIRAAGGKAEALRADVADRAAVAALFDATEGAFGPIDAVVTSAGVMALSPIASSTSEEVDRQIDINLKGTIHTLREAARRLRDGGRIVTLSTSVVGLKLETYGVYAATKAAVETLSAILAKELRGRSICVNSVAPGPTATDLFLEGKSDALIARLAAMPPLERLAAPEDIANVVSLLCGPDGGWINGQTLRANGGLV